MLVSKLYYTFSFSEITKSMTHIARIQSKDTHYKLRLLFQISISTAHT